MVCFSSQLRVARFQHVRPVFFALLLALLLGPMQEAVGQDANPQVRQQALEAFHGPDLEGKDGPLAKAGFDLALLYYEWKAAQQQGTAADVAPSSSLPVRAGRVTIDATAAQSPSALRDSLEALGLTNAAQAGPVVSGRLPIAAIPEAARLDNLRAMRPSRAQTHGGTSPPPSDTTYNVARDTTIEGVAPGDGSQAPYWIGGAIILIVGTIFFVLQRRV